MEEERIQKLLDELFSKKYTGTYTHSGSTYESFVIAEEGRSIIESIIRTNILENREEKLGILEAKVFVYEEIISKSNFAQMIKSDSFCECTDEPMRLEMSLTKCAKCGKIVEN